MELEGNSGKDTFLLSEPPHDCFISLLKTHKFSKEKGCNLVYKVGHGLLLEERRAFDFCFFFFLSLLSRMGMVCC